MTRRKLRPDELDLWQKVARTAERFDSRGYFAPVEQAGPEAIPDVQPKARPKRAVIPEFKLGQAHRGQINTATLPVNVSDRLAQDRVDMDHKAFGRMKRGKLVPEARMDLHGMTMDEAHPELIRFILTSQARGLRLVLVITGKGQREDLHDPVPMRRGVLKRQVPLWLKMAPVSQAVLQIAESHVRHGGSGAYYVYLRRRR